MFVTGLIYYFLKDDPINEYYFELFQVRPMTGYSFKFLSKRECQFIIDEAENEWTKKASVLSNDRSTNKRHT